MTDLGFGLVVQGITGINGSGLFDVNSTSTTYFQDTNENESYHNMNTELDFTEKIVQQSTRLNFSTTPFPSSLRMGQFDPDLNQSVLYTSTTPSTSADQSCNIYKDWRKGSKGVIVKGYEGIPQNLVLNIIGSLVLIFVFSIMRKKAWNYGRIALVQRNEVRWTDMFYGSTDFSTQIRTRSLMRTGGGQQSVLIESDESAVLDRGLFNWILITLRLTDEQFFAKSGPDAVQYLSYQRHLIFLASIVTVTSLIIILPLNFQGTKERSDEANSDVSDFKQSTIVNLGPDSKLLWVHVLISITFLFLSIAVMRHFSRALKFVENDSTVCRTITITGIAKKSCQEEKLRSHFEELYPDLGIEEINFAYDISRLQASEISKTDAISARKYWENYLEASGKRPTMRPYICGNICCCCWICGLQSTDAIEFYAGQEQKFRKEAKVERKRALIRPLGIAFVTFKTVELAEKVISDHRFTAKCLNQTPISRYSRTLKSKQWIVYFAPLPEDLYWENLSLGFKAWYFKAFLVNVTLILLIIFYSTPVFLLNALNAFLEYNVRNNTDPQHSSTLGGVLSDTIPTMLLWLAAVTLPSLVSVSDRIIGFWTKTNENRSRMIKTFTFLLFMVIILPSLGLTSLSTWVGNRDLRWDCIFFPSNGSFFVNYVITSTFLGTISELMRIPELFVYSIRLCFAKSSAETAAIRQASLWDFQLGSQYAWMMLIFAIFVIFSVVVPVITPVGLVYLIFKHFVDRYNIYFAYAPCKVDKEVHGTAINFVMVCMFLLQIILLAYTNSGTPKRELNKPLQVFSIIGFCITAALFIGQVFFNMCANFSPILYKRMSQENLTDGTTHSTSPFTATERVPEVQVTLPQYRVTSRPTSEDGQRIRTECNGGEIGQAIRKILRERTHGRYCPPILRRDYRDRDLQPKLKPSQLIASATDLHSSASTSSLIEKDEPGLFGVNSGGDMALTKVTTADLVINNFDGASADEAENENEVMPEVIIQRNGGNYNILKSPDG